MSGYVPHHRRRGGGNRGRGRRFDYDDPRYTQIEERVRRQVGTKRSRDDYETTEDQERSFNERLKALIVRIGEKSQSPLARNLDMLSKILMEDISDAKVSSYIKDMIFECVVKLPVKTPIYACLVGLVNTQEKDFGAEVVQQLTTELVQALESKDLAEDVHRLRVLVRFMMCLQNNNVILGADCVKVFKGLLRLAGQDVTTYQKDALVHTVVSSLCWGGAYLKEKYPEKLTVIMSQIEVYMEQRGPRAVPEPYRSFKNDKSDYLSELWQAVKNLDNSDWVVDSILEPESEFSRLKKSHQHPLKWTFNGSWTRDERVEWIQMGVPKILDTSSMRDADNVPLIERCVVSEYIHDLFMYFGSDPKLCVEQLLNMPITKWEKKYLVIEAVFGHLLRLPWPFQNPCFYTRLIIELFKKDPKVWPKVIGATINTLFHDIEKLDIEARTRISTWFSHHLINFNHQWPWQNWAFVQSYDHRSPKRVFIEDVLSMNIIFSYYDRVYKTFPADLKDLVPKKPEPNYRFSKKNVAKNIFPNPQPEGAKSLNDLAGELLRIVNQRLSPDEVESLLDTYVVDGHGKWASLELVFTVLLHTGRQSYSHFQSGLNTYRSIVKDLLTTPAAQVEAVDLLHIYWRKCLTNVRHLVDKLQALKLVSCKSIVEWIFDDRNRKDLWRSFYFQMAIKTVTRTVKVRESLLAAIERERATLEAPDKKKEGSDSSGSEDEQVRARKKRMANLKLQKLQTALKKKNQEVAGLFTTLFTKTKSAIEWAENEFRTAEGGEDALAASAAKTYLASLVGRFTQLLRVFRSELEAHNLREGLGTEVESSECEDLKTAWEAFWKQPDPITYHETIPASFLENVQHQSIHTAAPDEDMSNLNASLNTTTSSSAANTTKTSIDSSSSDSSDDENDSKMSNKSAKSNKSASGVEKEMSNKSASGVKKEEKDTTKDKEGREEKEGMDED